MSGGGTQGGSMGNFDPNRAFPSASSAFGAKSMAGTPDYSRMGGSLGNFDPNNPFPSSPAGPMMPLMGRGMPMQAQSMPAQSMPTWDVSKYGMNPDQYTGAITSAQDYQALDQAKAAYRGMQQNAHPIYDQSQQAPQAPQPTLNTKVGQGYQQGPNGTIQFTPPAYPTWLYGPTAGAFGGVTPPPGTPQSYGYFPGTQTWGAQPNGNNFR